LGQALGDGGFAGAASWGLDQISTMAPGAADLVGGFLGGADPSSLLAGASESALAQAVSSWGDRLGLDLGDSADDLVGALTPGDAQSFVDGLGEQLGGFVSGLGSAGATQLVDHFLDGDNFGGLLQQAGGSALGELLGKVADGGDLEAVLGRLDTAQTADLVQTLLGAAGGAVGGVAGAVAGAGIGVADDALGVGAVAGAGAAGVAAGAAAAAAGAGAATTAAGRALADADDALGVGAVAGPRAAAGVAGATGAAAAGMDDDTGDVGGLASSAGSDDWSDSGDSGAGTAAAADDTSTPEDDADDSSALSQRFAGADAAKDSVDEMFDDLT
jgi:hypothetical protein